MEGFWCVSRGLGFSSTTGATISGGTALRIALFLIWTGSWMISSSSGFFYGSSGTTLTGSFFYSSTSFFWTSSFYFLRLLSEANLFRRSSDSYFYITLFLLSICWRSNSFLIMIYFFIDSLNSYCFFSLASFSSYYFLRRRSTESVLLELLDDSSYDVSELSELS